MKEDEQTTYREALEIIARMWCQHDSEMRGQCAKCIAMDALGWKGTTQTGPSVPRPKPEDVAKRLHDEMCPKRISLQNECHCHD